MLAEFYHAARAEAIRDVFGGVDGDIVIGQARLDADRFVEGAGLGDGRIDALVFCASPHIPNAFGVLDEFGAFGVALDVEETGQDDGRVRAWSMPWRAVSSWPIMWVAQS